MQFTKKFWREYSPVFLIFLLWRTGLFLVAYLGSLFLGFNAGFPYIETFLIGSGFPQWFWQWGNFDGVHYLNIAANGYQDYGVQAFFPLYPKTIWLLNYITHNSLLSGFLISNTSVLLVGILLYKLVKRDFDKNTALWSVVFLFAFPASFFFGSLYSEALFMVFVLGSFYFTGIPAGIFAFFAALTRIIGVFLSFVAAVDRRRAWLCLSIGGLFAYMGFLYLEYANPLMFLSAQQAFSNSRASSFFKLTTPFQVMFRYLKIFLTDNPSHYDFWIAVLEFTAFVLGTGFLLWITYKRQVKTTYLFYAWPALLLPSLSGTFSSMPRYLIVVFPLYIGLARLKNRHLKVGILVSFIVLLALLTILFTRGYWVS